MARRKLVYEGKAKILYEGPEPGTLVQYFKDDATAFNAEKKDIIEGKGVLNNRLSEFFMTGLNTFGHSDPFHQKPQHARAIDPRGRDRTFGSHRAQLCRRHHVQAFGHRGGHSHCRVRLLNFVLKDDSLGDPLVSEEHIIAFNWASQQDLDDMLALALRVNDFLSGVMYGVGIRVADFKIEIGRVYEGDYQRLIIADEISPDSCRLWDLKTGEKLDKGRVPS